MQQSNQPECPDQALNENLIQHQESEKDNNENSVSIPIKPSTNQNNQNSNREPLLQIQENEINQVDSSEINDLNQIFEYQLIKDIHFSKQKVILIKILGLFLIMSFFYIFILKVIFREIYFQKTFNSAIVIVFIWMILMPIGIMKQNRENFKAIVLFLTLTVVQTFSTIYFYYMMSYFFSLYFFYAYEYWSDKEQGYTYFQECLLKLISTLFNSNAQILYSIITISTMFYIESLKRKFIIQQYMIIVVIIALVAGVLFNFQLFLAGIVYGVLLANVLLQIQKGRFKLKTNEVITGVMALNYGFYVPYWVEK